MVSSGSAEAEKLAAVWSEEGAGLCEWAGFIKSKSLISYICSVSGE